MKVKSKARHIHISPRKCRKVTDLVRGKDANQAEVQLKYLSKRSSDPILRLLNSAIASAEHNHNLDKDNLFISEIYVDEGPTLKRWMPRAFGRTYPIMKRTSHITLILDEKVKGKKKKTAVKTGKKIKEKKVENKKEEKAKTGKEKFRKDNIAKDKTKTDKGMLKKIFRRKSV